MSDADHSVEFAIALDIIRHVPREWHGLLRLLHDLRADHGAGELLNPAEHALIDAHIGFLRGAAIAAGAPLQAAFEVLDLRPWLLAELEPDLNPQEAR